MILRKGTIVGQDFKIDGKLPGGDGGGTAKVYLASYIEDSDKKVAIKLAFSDSNNGPNSNDNLLQREAEILQQPDWRHPGIVRIYPLPGKRNTFVRKAVEIESAPYFFTMEPLYGNSLEHYKNEILKFPLMWRLELFYQIAVVIAFIHSKDYGHRDLKPENIMFRKPISRDELPLPVLIDFALATNGDEGMHLVKDAMTWVYASPERVFKFMGHDIPVCQKESDIWSLAIILYEMLTGKLPYKKGQDSSVKNVRTTITSGDIAQNIQDFPLGGPSMRLLSDMLREMVAQEHQKRPSIKEVIAAFEDCFRPPRII